MPKDRIGDYVREKILTTELLQFLDKIPQEARLEFLLCEPSPSGLRSSTGTHVMVLYMEAEMKKGENSV